MVKFKASFGETFCLKFLTLSVLKSARFAFVVLALFFNFRFFGEAIEFCFDGSKEGYRLDSIVVKYLYARTGMDCIEQCLLQDDLCRSVNFRKCSALEEEATNNCELLYSIDSEQPGKFKDNEKYDYYILLEPNRSPPKSCKEILEKSPEAASGLYDISIDNTTITVFCDMVLHGGGFTFIPKSAVKEGTLPNLVPQLFTNHSEALLYIQNKDGTQKYTLIQQLKKESRTPLHVLQNKYTGDTDYRPHNYKMLDYLYLSTSINIGGFLSNNIKVTYKYGNFPIRNYFAFFPNHRGQPVDGYHNHNSKYETGGVSVGWRKTGIHASVNLPSDFFFLTEMHYGGSGCYTSSDRWTEANGTAIGLR